MPELETIKLSYSTHRQQTAVRNDYAYDAQPYSATSIANILLEDCRLAGIKRGVTPLRLRNFIGTDLHEKRVDLGYIQEHNSCSSQANLGWKEQLIVSVKGKKHSRYITTMYASLRT